MGNGDRKEFCCDAAYEGWGCNCKLERRKDEMAKQALENKRLEMERESKRRNIKVLLDKRIENEYDGRYSIGKIVSYISDKSGYSKSGSTGTIKSLSKDRKSIEILWHNSAEIQKISHSEGIVLAVLYSEYEMKNNIPDYEKYSTYFEEFPDLKDEDSQDYEDYDYDYDEEDDDYY